MEKRGGGGRVDRVIGGKCEDFSAGLKLLKIRQGYAGTRPGNQMFDLRADEVKESD